MQTLINQGKFAVTLQDDAGKSANVSGTSKQIDTPLTQCGSLDVLARHLIRLRPSYGSKQRRFISDLAEQCKNYEAGNAYLARRMIETMERIEGPNTNSPPTTVGDGLLAQALPTS